MKPFYDYKQIKVGQSYTVPRGLKCTILTGGIAHVTGTETRVRIENPRGTVVGTIALIGALQDTADYPGYHLFREDATTTPNTWEQICEYAKLPLEIPEDWSIVMTTGHANSSATYMIKLERME